MTRITRTSIEAVLSNANCPFQKKDKVRELSGKKRSGEVVGKFFCNDLEDEGFGQRVEVRWNGSKRVAVVRPENISVFG